MDIAFLVPRLDKPSTKFRVQSYLPFLSEQGIKTSIFTLSPKAVARWRILFRLRQYQLVIIQKKLFSLLELFLIRRVAKKMVYDFDDAVMFKSAEHVDSIAPLRQKRFGWTVRLCDWTIAGNTYLRDEAGHFSKRISVLPTPVDTDRYIPREAVSPAEGVTIGWIGSKSTVTYVASLLPVFSDLKVMFPEISIRVVSDRFDGIQGSVGVEKVPWNEKEEVKTLQSFDIGIMPLPDDPWTRGKCGFKLLQYQAIGIPVVCSPVGANRTVVTEGVNGLFATEKEEWVKRLSLLITSPELRMRMGRAGRRIVINEYSLKAIWPQFFSIIKRAVTSPQV